MFSSFYPWDISHKDIDTSFGPVWLLNILYSVLNTGTFYLQYDCVCQVVLSKYNSYHSVFSPAVMKFNRHFRKHMVF